MDGKKHCLSNIWGQKDVLERGLLCSPRLHLFDKNYSKNSNSVKYYYYLK